MKISSFVADDPQRGFHFKHRGRLSTPGFDADTVDGKHANEFAATIHAHAQST